MSEDPVEHLPAVHAEGRNHAATYDVDLSSDRTLCGLFLHCEPSPGSAVWSEPTGPVDCPGCLAAWGRPAG